MLCESKGNLESSFELTYQTKRQLTFIGFALRRFAAGIDYMIIIPSLWFYLESFNCQYYFLGLVISADTFVSFILSPWIEKIAEKSGRIRLLGFFANLFQIGGSMIYALPLYFYMPLVGRLVSGMGESFGGALYGEVKRRTTPEERIRVTIIMEGVRLFGIVIGPGMNFFLKNFDLKFGPWIIDRRTAPGFFMAIVWLLIQVVHIFTVYDLVEDPLAYKELPSEVVEHAEHEEKPTTHRPIDESEQLDVLPSSDENEATSGEEDDYPSEKIKIAEDDDGNKDIECMAIPHKNEMAKDEVYPSDSENLGSRKGSPNIPIDELSRGDNVRGMLGRRDVMVILIAQFLMFLNQTAFETLLLVIGVEKLNFNINILSTVFILAGVEMVAVIIVVWSANKSIDAKYLLLTCLSAGILASFARLAVSFTKPHSAGCLAMTLLMGFFTIIGTPITSIAGKSLLPKVTPEESHGFYQSALATAQHLGLVMGPLLASVLYNYLWIFSSVMVVLFLVVYMVTLAVVEKLDVPAQGCGKQTF